MFHEIRTWLINITSLVIILKKSFVGDGVQVNLCSPPQAKKRRNIVNFSISSRLLQMKAFEEDKTDGII